MGKFWKDALERVLWTFVESVLGVVLLGNILDIEVWQQGLIAGATTVLALVKTFAAQFVGDSEAASIGGSTGRHVAE